MRVYNTLTKKIEDFIPFEEGVVRMYTCGPTVYNYAHIGNLRTYIFEDVLEKSLKYIGYRSISNLKFKIFSGIFLKQDILSIKL